MDLIGEIVSVVSFFLFIFLIAKSRHSKLSDRNFFFFWNVHYKVFDWFWTILPHKLSLCTPFDNVVIEKRMAMWKLCNPHFFMLWNSVVLNEPTEPIYSTTVWMIFIFILKRLIIGSPAANHFYACMGALFFANCSMNFRRLCAVVQILQIVARIQVPKCKIELDMKCGISFVARLNPSSDYILVNSCQNFA